jgi:hypothetical protein
MELDELVAQLSATNLRSEINIDRRLIGGYSWETKGNLFIPAVPVSLHYYAIFTIQKKLKNNYLNVTIGRLPDSQMTMDEVHPNEYFHSRYFEPMQLVLSDQQDGKLFLKSPNFSRYLQLQNRYR